MKENENNFNFSLNYLPLEYIVFVALDPVNFYLPTTLKIFTIQTDKTIHFSNQIDSL